MEEGGGMEVELSGNHSGRRQMFQMSLDVAVTSRNTHTEWAEWSRGCIEDCCFSTSNLANASSMGRIKQAS